MLSNKGLSVFITKNAEEEPWLVQHAFVPPPEFEFLKGLSSNIVFAKPGTGKTAFGYALMQYARDQLHCLPTYWSFDFTNSSRTAGTEQALSLFSSILSACAHEILLALSFLPKKRSKQDDLPKFVIEFLYHFIPQEDQALLKKTIPYHKPVLISSETKLEVIATELVKNIRSMGFGGGIWVNLDGLNWHTEQQKQHVIVAMKSLFSTLQLFEISGFYFKIFLPIELERELVGIPVRIKERVTASRISWEPKYLQAVIEKRLRFALGDNLIQLNQIYPAGELCTWLEACGGLSPRGWLEYFRPIFGAVWEKYTSKNLYELSKEEWDIARKRSPLQLRFDPVSRQVVVGMNSPRTLSQEEAAIFSYLYENEGRFCSKRELYNKAYLPFNTKGQGKELGPNDELAKEFDDLVNTAIHRLRKTIEPLPKDPVFLTMKKNLGYRLSLQAFAD
jgi:hypothetical protein